MAGTFRDAIGTLVAVLLAFAAFDDITTGNETDFRVEYAALLGCATWLMFVAARLLRNDHQALGAISLAALVGAVWGQRGIGPGATPGFWPEYVVTAGALLWFATLSVILLSMSWRAHSEQTRQTDEQTRG